MARRRETRSTKYIDKEKARKEQEVKDAMRLAIECGDEEGFMELLKLSKPDLIPKLHADRLTLLDSTPLFYRFLTAPLPKMPLFFAGPTKGGSI